MKKPSIHFYLIGPGYGECIIVVIGKKFIIGIDSCHKAHQPLFKDLSLLDDILNNVDKDAEIYWILTHYHGDHFQALPSILKTLKTKLKTIVTPSSYTIADIHYNLEHYTNAKDIIWSKSIESRSSKQYKEIKNLLEMEFLRRKNTTSSSGKSLLIERPIKISEESFNLTLNFYAPFTSDIDKMKANQIKKLMINNKTKEIDRSIANEGCYIIHLKCGNLEALFLGDAPIERTLDILPTIQNNKNLDGSSNKNFLLKVSHHGSKTGTSEALLEKFEVFGEKKYALITPFGSKLPEHKIVNLLKEKNYDIFSTNVVPKNENEKIYKEINSLIPGSVDSFIPTKQVISHIEINLEK